MNKKNPFFLKSYFLVALLAVSLASFLYIQDIIFKLEETSLMQSRIFARFTSEVFTKNGQKLTDEIIFEEIIQNIKFPIIVTDSLENPVAWRNLGYLDTVFSLEGNPSYQADIRRIIGRLDSENKPIELKYNENVFAIVHTGVDPLYKRLQFAPFFQIIVSAVFVLVGIYGFLFFKKSEENIIWAGMAKETAHQIGTPLTSLKAWVQILKDRKVDEKIVNGINEDSVRLEIIANRFNKIGSPLTIELADVNREISEIIKYFESRAPHSTKQSVSFVFDGNGELLVPVDKDLFKWSIENLVKNSMDALTGIKSGEIRIETKLEQSRALIRVSDNGTGIEKKNLEKIFEVGFSTKNYGWGIGLPLSKKIIEEFHRGKLVLEYTMTGKGTRFAVTLPLTRQEG
ncbi:MAG: HAMP domain-containing sensor histidine kinase [bacterium]|nr:HAMP domain-containing sensor histidine kinase [bacterium]